MGEPWLARRPAACLRDPCRHRHEPARPNSGRGPGVRRGQCADARRRPRSGDEPSGVRRRERPPDEPPATRIISIGQAVFRRHRFKPGKFRRHPSRARLSRRTRAPGHRALRRSAAVGRRQSDAHGRDGRSPDRAAQDRARRRDRELRRDGDGRAGYPHRGGLGRLRGRLSSCRVGLRRAAPARGLARRTGVSAWRARARHRPRDDGSDDVRRFGDRCGRGFGRRPC